MSVGHVISLLSAIVCVYVGFGCVGVITQIDCRTVESASAREPFLAKNRAECDRFGICIFVFGFVHDFCFFQLGQSSSLGIRLTIVNRRVQSAETKYYDFWRKGLVLL